VEGAALAYRARGYGGGDDYDESEERVRLIDFKLVNSDGETFECAINPAHIVFIRRDASGRALMWITGDDKAIEPSESYEDVIKRLRALRA
jgi:hypothetical protein